MLPRTRAALGDDRQGAARRLQPVHVAETARRVAWATSCCEPPTRDDASAAGAAAHARTAAGRGCPLVPSTKVYVADERDLFPAARFKTLPLGPGLQQLQPAGSRDTRSPVRARGLKQAAALGIHLARERVELGAVPVSASIAPPWRCARTALGRQHRARPEEGGAACDAARSPDAASQQQSERKQPPRRHLRARPPFALLP